MVVSPGSGRVVDVSEVYEDRYLQENAVKVGIFLSVFDAHINCAPISGKIGYQHYVMGKFLNALDPESVNYNESNWIGIESGEKRVLARQISGAIARRIHWDVRPKDEIRRGDKFGIICYGSRVECYVPVRFYRVTCKIGDYVRSGVSTASAIFSILGTTNSGGTSLRKTETREACPSSAIRTRLQRGPSRAS